MLFLIEILGDVDYGSLPLAAQTGSAWDSGVRLLVVITVTVHVIVDDSVTIYR
jgi:hypothetical protein